MTTSYDRLSLALDRAPSPITFFFRDDDVGWADERLLVLCDLFAQRAPLDLAVIPMAIGGDIADVLLAHEARLGFHQHGYAHRNHQRTGRKCELSDERSRDELAIELCSGRSLLRLLFGHRLDPIFTPPWNRCGTATGHLLTDLGISVLSRDPSASALGVTGLIELPITVDFVRHRADIDAAVAAATTENPVGIMLHHEVLDTSDLRAIDALLDVLIAHPNAEIEPMMAVARQAVAR